MGTAVRADAPRAKETRSARRPSEEHWLIPADTSVKPADVAQFSSKEGAPSFVMITIMMLVIAGLWRWSTVTAVEVGYRSGDTATTLEEAIHQCTESGDNSLLSTLVTANGSNPELDRKLQDIRARALASMDLLAPAAALSFNVQRLICTVCGLWELSMAIALLVFNWTKCGAAPLRRCRQRFSCARAGGCGHRVFRLGARSGQTTIAALLPGIFTAGAIGIFSYPVFTTSMKSFSLWVLSDGTCRTLIDSVSDRVIEGGPHSPLRISSMLMGVLFTVLAAILPSRWSPRTKIATLEISLAISLVGHIAHLSKAVEIQRDASVIYRALLPLPGEFGLRASIAATLNYEAVVVSVLASSEALFVLVMAAVVVPALCYSMYGLWARLLLLSRSQKEQQERMAELSRVTAQREALRVFMRYLGHEVRNPLHAVSGCVSGVVDFASRGQAAVDAFAAWEKSSLKDERGVCIAMHALESDLPTLHEDVSALQLSLSTAISTLSDVLDYNKLMEGKLDAPVGVVKLHSFLEHIRNQATTMLPRGINPVRLLVDPDLPTHALTSEMRLHQVLLNAATNASKSMHKRQKYDRLQEAQGGGIVPSGATNAAAGVESVSCTPLSLGGDGTQVLVEAHLLRTPAAVLHMIETRAAPQARRALLESQLLEPLDELDELGEPDEVRTPAGSRMATDSRRVPRNTGPWMRTVHQAHYEEEAPSRGDGAEKSGDATSQPGDARWARVLHSGRRVCFVASPKFTARVALPGAEEGGGSSKDDQAAGAASGSASPGESFAWLHLVVADSGTGLGEIDPNRLFLDFDQAQTSHVVEESTAATTPQLATRAPLRDPPPALADAQPAEQSAQTRLLLASVGHAASGTGLGLAISRRIVVNLLDGFIMMCDRCCARGAEFHVIVPLTSAWTSPSTDDAGPSVFGETLRDLTDQVGVEDSVLGPRALPAPVSTAAVPLVAPHSPTIILSPAGRPLPHPGGGAAPASPTVMPSSVPAEPVSPSAGPDPLQRSDAPSSLSTRRGPIPGGLAAGGGAASNASSQPPESLRILIADDHDTNRRWLQRALVKLGHAVDVVDDGVGILHAYGLRWEHGAATGQVPPERAAAYDVIITDVRMAVLAGHLACRALRHAGLRVPVIYCTGLASEPAHAAALFGPTAPYHVLTKPFGAEELAAALGEVLRSPSRADQ